MPQAKRRLKRRPQAVRFVYFIESVQLGLIKIGSADDPRRRIATLRTGCPDELHLAGVMAAEDARDLERQMHVRFAEQRVRGEWFRPNDKMREFIGLLPGADFIDDPWFIAGDPTISHKDSVPPSHFGIREGALALEMVDECDDYPKPEMEQLTAVCSLIRAGWTHRRVVKTSRADRVAAWQALLVAQGDGPTLQ